MIKERIFNRFTFLCSAIVLLILFLASLWFMGRKEKAPEETLRVYCNREQTELAIFQIGEGEYASVLPQGWTRQGVFIRDQEGGDVLLGQENVSEELFFPELNVPYAIDIQGEAGTSDQQLALTFYETGEAVMFIQTESGTMDKVNSSKEIKEKGKLIVVDAKGEITYKGELDWIHGRGNYTWNKNKKPYNIKLSSETSLLGLSVSNKYCLLANYMDESQLRNYVVYKTAIDLKVPAAVDCAYVQTYFNGEYAGLYLLTEKIEVGKNGLDITSLEANTQEENPLQLDQFEQWSSSDGSEAGSCKGIEGALNPKDITGGYLLELDQVERKYPEAVSGFVSQEGQAVILNSPEYATREQVEYISGYYQKIEDALLAEDGINPDTGKHYSEYLDIDSFARAYLIDELFMNVDSGATSIFLYKDSDKVNSKLFAGPIWDYDNSIGNYTSMENINDNLAVLNPECLIANRYVMNDAQKMYCVLYSMLCSHPEFMDYVINLYCNEFRERIVDWVTGKLDAVYQEEQQDINLNYLRWPSAKGMTCTEEVEYMKEFLNKRISFLDKIWIEGQPYCTVQINTNQASINTLYDVVAPGENFTPPLLQVNGATLIGYKDAGTDQWFEDGSQIEEDTILVAQWEEQTGQESSSNLKTVIKKGLNLVPLAGFILILLFMTGMALWRYSRSGTASPKDVDQVYKIFREKKS